MVMPEDASEMFVLKLRSGSSNANRRAQFKMACGDVCCQTQACNSTKVLIENQATDVTSKGTAFSIYLTRKMFRKPVNLLEEFNTLKAGGENFFPFNRMRHYLDLIFGRVAQSVL
jgi:hypothetical protein